MADATAAELQHEKLRHEWFKLEYEEVNRYGRTVYETIFRLAQMTFVVNPGLGAGFYYVFFEKRDFLSKQTLFDEIGVVGIAISILGVVYNLGAYGVYVQSHAFLEALLIRVRQLDELTESKLHVALEATAPYSYRRFWGNRVEDKYDSADMLTRAFLQFLFVSWAVTLSYAFYVLLLPKNNLYLLAAVAVTFVICIGILFAFSRMQRSRKPGDQESPVPSADLLKN